MAYDRLPACTLSIFVSQASLLGNAVALLGNAVALLGYFMSIAAKVRMEVMVRSNPPPLTLYFS